MRLPSVLVAAVFVVASGAALMACEHSQPVATAPPAPVPPAPVPPATSQPVSPPVVSASALTMAMLVDPATTPDPPPIAELRQRIAGRENESAERVFDNVTTLTNLTASELLGTMKAFNEALGVRCTFCHEAGRWESDMNHHKGITHGMIRMTHQINAVDLVRAEADEGSRITCYTCHRGRTRPQLNPADTVRRRTPPPSGNNH